MIVAKYNMTIVQGATFKRTFNWYGGSEVMHEIEDVIPGFPTIVKITGHGLPTVSSTPVFIANVKGTTAINTKDCKASEATFVDVDTFSLPVSTTGKEWEEGTGDAKWHEPSDIGALKARMQIRERQDSDEIIHELTTENGGITLESADGGINLYISAADTATFDFTTAVYDLEIVDDSGAEEDVTRIVEGSVTLHPETTR